MIICNIVTLYNVFIKIKFGMYLHMLPYINMAKITYRIVFQRRSIKENMIIAKSKYKLQKCERY